MHCKDWHRKEECSPHKCPDGYNDHHPSELIEFGVPQLVGKHTIPSFCASCASVHHPPCCDFCCA